MDIERTNAERTNQGEGSNRPNSSGEGLSGFQHFDEDEDEEDF